jgi:hypothetical protein
MPKRRRALLNVKINSTMLDKLDQWLEVVEIGARRADQLIFMP